MNKEIAVLKNFLKIPLGSSDEVFAQFAGIPGAMRYGKGLEQFLFIEGHRTDRVLLVAHADTVWDAYYFRGRNKPQKLLHVNDIIWNANGGLGADDRAGCAIVWLLKDLGHSILITNGEELGGTASQWLMNDRSNQKIATTINTTHRFAVQLDRKNGHDFKCYQVGTDSFRAYIREVTGYHEPNRSNYTDIVTLCRDICGVNLSIGYYHPHTEDEYLVVNQWLNTLNLCRRWLSEPFLPHFPRDRSIMNSGSGRSSNTGPRSIVRSPAVPGDPT